MTSYLPRASTSHNRAALEEENDFTLSQSNSPTNEQANEPDYEDDGEDYPATGSTKRKLTRNAKACLACRKVKTKCNNDGTAPCRRCSDNNLECIFGKSRRGGRQPGAKNLSTLIAQGIIPKNSAKAKQSRANARPTSSSRPSSRRSSVAPSRNTTPTATDRSNLVPFPTETYQSSTQYAQPSFMTRAQSGTIDPKVTSTSANLFSSGNSKTRKTHTNIISPTALRSFDPADVFQEPAFEPDFHTDRRPHHDSFSSMSSFGQDNIDTRMLGIDSMDIAGSPMRDVVSPISFAAQSTSHPNLEPGSVKFLTSENRTTVTSLPPSPVLPTLPHLAGIGLQNPGLMRLLNSNGSQLSDDEDMTGESIKTFAPKKLDPISLLQSAALMRSRQQETLPGIIADDTHIGVNNASSSIKPSQIAGIADASYFLPGRLTKLSTRKKITASEMQPEIMSIITADDISILVEFYFANLHHHFPILNPGFHRADRVAQRSPFLLTIICALAAHFHPSFAAVALTLAQIARRLCFEVPSRGSKTVEIVQAGVLMTIWQTEAPHRWEEDVTNLILGLAKSSAADLGLHRIDSEHSHNGKGHLEMENRTRTFLLTFLRDREFAVLLGRSATMRETSALRTPEVFLPSPPNLDDLAVCMMTELYRIVYQTLILLGHDNEPVEIDYMAVTSQFEENIANWRARFIQAADAAPNKFETQTTHEMFLSQLNFANHFAMLNIGSFGLADSLERQPIHTPHYFGKCFKAACAVLETAIQCITDYPTYRYAPDSFYVEMSYAAVSLLRFCRPKLSHLHDDNDAILDLVTKTANTLDGNALSPVHMCGQYTIFLRALIAAHHSGPFVSAAPTPRAASPAFEQKSSMDDDLMARLQRDESTQSLLDGFDCLPSNSGLDQLLPSQWSMLDQRFDTIYSLKASDTWNSVRMPGFDLPNFSNDDFDAL